jgi:RNA polymerase subunit RPABC4/transcription elongation factor Spt4
MKKEECPKCGSRDIISEQQRFAGGSTGDRECNACGFVSDPSSFVLETCPGCHAEFTTEALTGVYRDPWRGTDPTVKRRWHTRCHQDEYNRDRRRHIFEQ